MSHIDTIKHKVLGEIGYLPVYLLEQDENDEFNSPKGTVLLGGGGGEHPALSIKNLDFVVLEYLYINIDKLKPDNLSNLEYLKLKREAQLEEFEERVLDLMDELNVRDNCEYDYYKVLQFNNWGLDNYAEIVNYRKTTQDVYEYNCTEDWLCYKVGEFIVLNCPELNHYKKLFNDFEELKNKINEKVCENDLVI